MSDTPPTSSPPSEPAEPRSSDEGRSSGWLDRLRAAVGLKPAAQQLRHNLETELERTDDDPASAFTSEERELLRNILRLRETRVEDVMIPRADIGAVPVHTTLSELMLAFKASGHSRMPVYRETLDDSSGMVHIRDLMGYIAEAAVVPASRLDTREKEAAGVHLTQVDLGVTIEQAGLVRPLLDVPPSIPVIRLLEEMQEKRIQMALVIDEYGGVDGLASLEDIVEAVFGDIEDEHDVAEEPLVKPSGVDTWIADGQADLDEISEAVGETVEVERLADEVDTVGGLVVALAGRVPEPGETITADDLPGLAFRVVEADQLKVTRLEVRRLPKDTDQAA